MPGTPSTIFLKRQFIHGHIVTLAFHPGMGTSRSSDRNTRCPVLACHVETWQERASWLAEGAGRTRLISVHFTETGSIWSANAAA